MYSYILTNLDLLEIHRNYKKKKRMVSNRSIILKKSKKTQDSTYESLVFFCLSEPTRDTKPIKKKKKERLLITVHNNIKKK